MNREPKYLPKRGTAAGGYTLVEVLVAAALLAVAVAAAASLALSMVSQEESNTRIARAFNQQEQAARLYQLGLDPTTVTNLLPPEPNVVSISFTTSTLTVAGVGDVDQAVCSMVFHGGTPLTSDSVVPVLRTNNIVVIRPTIR